MLLGHGPSDSARTGADIRPTPSREAGSLRMEANIEKAFLLPPVPVNDVPRLHKERIRDMPRSFDAQPQRRDSRGNRSAARPSSA